MKKIKKRKTKKLVAKNIDEKNKGMDESSSEDSSDSQENLGLNLNKKVRYYKNKNLRA